MKKIDTVPDYVEGVGLVDDVEEPKQDGGHKGGFASYLLHWPYPGPSDVE